MAEQCLIMLEPLAFALLFPVSAGVIDFLVNLHFDDDLEAASLVLGCAEQPNYFCIGKSRPLALRFSNRARLVTDDANKCIQFLSKSLQLDWQPKYWVQLAAVLHRLKRYEDLLTETGERRVLQEGENFWEAKIYKAMALLNLGRFMDGLWLAEQCQQSKEAATTTLFQQLRDEVNEKMRNPLTGKKPTQEFWNHWPTRSSLSIWKERQQFMDMLDRNKVVILSSEPGSGKTTQIPQWCAEKVSNRAGKNVVVCTLPRRDATVQMANCVAQQNGIEVGKSVVGYSIRFDKRNWDRKCGLIKYCTEGVLLGEATNRLDLWPYAVIILDEVHTRSENTDLLLAKMKELIFANEYATTKLVIMSATLDVEKFRNYFGGNPACLTIPAGEGFQVETKCSSIMEESFKKFWIERYQNLNGQTIIKFHSTQESPNHSTNSSAADGKTEEKYYDNCDTLTRAIVYEIMLIHKSMAKDAHILVFLDGKGSIKAVKDALMDVKNELFNGATDLEIITYHSGNDNRPVFMETTSNARKCILATNIAETSLTLKNIVVVIDTGLQKCNNFDQQNLAYSLDKKPISKASAKQRKGRVGRTCAGIYIQLYSGEKMNERELPEILRTDLVPVIFKMVQLQIPPSELIDAPENEKVSLALRILHFLGAVEKNSSDDETSFNDTNGQGKICATLTPLGRRLAYFHQLDPRLAMALVASAEEFNCSEDVLKIAVMLVEAQECVWKYSFKGEELEQRWDAVREKFAHPLGSHFQYLKIFNEFSEVAHRVRWRNEELRKWCKWNFLQFEALKNAYDLYQELLERMYKDSEFGLPLIQQHCNEQEHSVNIIKSFLAGYFMHTAFHVAHDTEHICCYARLIPSSDADKKIFFPTDGQKFSAIISEQLDRPLHVDTVQCSQLTTKGKEKVEVKQRLPRFLLPFNFCSGDMISNKKMVVVSETLVLPNWEWLLERLTKVGIEHIEYPKSSAEEMSRAGSANAHSEMDTESETESFVFVNRTW